MKVAALISGGKDSCYNMMTCIAEGHDIVALANLRPEDKDELDSYMYQTVGHHAIDLYAEAMDLPLYTRIIKGSSLSIGRDYQPQEGDEVEDLFQLLSQIKSEREIDAVSVGAILSDYQRVRVENVCQRLGLQVLAFLWCRNQKELLKEMIDSGVKAIIIKVAALGLLPDKHLGMELKDIFPYMKKMKDEYHLNICGEGGEYETFVFDCPIFKKSILIEDKELVIHSNDAFAPVGYLNLRKCSLQEKPGHDVSSFVKDIDNSPISTTKKWLAKQVARVDSDSSDYSDSEDGSSDSGDDSSDSDSNDHPRTAVTDTSNMPETIPHKPETIPEAEIISKPPLLEEEYEFLPTCGSDGNVFQVAGVTAIIDSAPDVSLAAELAMDSLKECIEKLGHTMPEVTSVSLYVGSMSNYATINNIYKQYFKFNPPTRICIQVCLPPTVLFQLDCEGSRPAKDKEDDRKTLHVQSLSLWAPANLGPFSQSILLNGKIYASGTTALVPSTLKIIDRDVDIQSRVALNHLVEKFYRLWSCSSLGSCPMMYCYVTKREHIPPAREEFEWLLQKSDAGALSLLPPVQYCVVPRLPQDALVEWQAYAWTFTDFDEEKIGLSQCKKNFPNWSGSFDWMWFEEHACCIIEISSSTPSQVDLKELASVLIQEYSRATAKRKQQSPPIGGLARIFYMPDIFSRKQLAECFSQTVPDVDPGDIPTFTFVPVLGLKTEQHILSWCQ